MRSEGRRRRENKHCINIYNHHESQDGLQTFLTLYTLISIIFYTHLFIKRFIQWNATNRSRSKKSHSN